ncbi:hypothetical protein IKE96_00860, partial [bacterium]|nr:hypothetical protein [bacterium]
IVITGDEVNNINYPILELPKIVQGGDIINFINPIVIDEENLRMVLNKNGEENIEYDQWFYALRIMIRTGTSPNYSYYTAEIYIDLNRNSPTYMDYIVSSNISYNDSGGTEKLFVLQRDSFFPNLITGFKWNGDDNARITLIESNTFLRYTTMRFMYSPEINKLKNIISESGQIEKTVDYQSKWTTDNQIIEHARSLIIQNSNVVNQVSLKYEENPNLKIGDIVIIDEPDFYIKGKFAVKEQTYTYKNDLDETWDIILKSADLFSTYIDLFRPIEKQESLDKIDTVILSEFIEETIEETHEFNLE